MIRVVAVVVPAANEQDVVSRCLDAVSVARARVHAAYDVSTRVIVALDRCVDGTEAAVRARPGAEVVHCDAGSAAGARAAGTAWLLRTVAASSAQVWLANTDADSIVPPDWLVRQVHEARHGAHVVLGTVEPGCGLPARVARAWRDHHQAGDGHPHVHGANLGIRADVLRGLGGWPVVSYGEDVALAERAARCGYVNVVRTGQIPVVTSSRRTSRTLGGFASYLGDMEAALDAS